MENQPPTGSASSWLHRRSPSPSATDQEIARLKERLGFYENFDQIIQDNISRASELLKNAVTVRESAEHELATAKEELEQSRITERSNYRALLSDLLDEVTNMQVQVERLARKVADALDDVEAALPGPDLDRLPGSSPALMALGATGAASTNAETGGIEAESLAAADEPAIASSGDVDDAEAIAVAGIPTTTPQPVTAASFHDADAAMSAEPAPTRGEDEDESDPGGPDPIAEAVRFAEIAAEPIATEEAEAELDTGDDTASAGEGDAAAVPIGPEGEPYAPNIDDEAAQFAAMAAESIPEEVAEAEPDSADGFATAVPALEASSATVETAPEVSAATAEQPDVPGDDVEPAEAAVEAGGAAETEAAVDAETSEPATTVEQPMGEVRAFPGVTTPPPAFRRSGTGELRFPNPLPPVAPRPLNAQPVPQRGASTTVLVHGVPRATTALSLKRYLEGLPHVGAVEPREYAEGILRLQVIGQRALQMDDLRGWPEGAQLETVHLRDDLIEVRLPH